jgi:hypothetical protein
VTLEEVAQSQRGGATAFYKIPGCEIAPAAAGGIMLKPLAKPMLILLAIGAIAVAPVDGKSNKDQPPTAAKIKKKIRQFGVNSPVTVRLTDGREVNAQVVEINDDTFVLSAGSPPDTITVAYSEVKQVKYTGSTGGANFGPAFLIAGAVMLLIKLLR